MSNRYRSPEMLAADHDVPGFECRSREQYDHTCMATPVMIHKTNILERNATAPPGTRIITASGLERLRAAAQPDTFTPNLAMSLNYLSNRPADLGRREDALAAIEKAVTLRHRAGQLPWADRQQG